MSSYMISCDPVTEDAEPIMYTFVYDWKHVDINEKCFSRKRKIKNILENTKDYSIE